MLREASETGYTGVEVGVGVLKLCPLPFTEAFTGVVGVEGPLDAVDWLCEWLTSAVSNNRFKKILWLVTVSACYQDAAKATKPSIN